MSEKLKKFELLADWNQFSKFEINFHPRVTILTGKNGVGKSTIMRTLARTFTSELQRETYSEFLNADENSLELIKSFLSQQRGWDVDVNLKKIPTALVSLLKEIKKNEEFEPISLIEFEDTKIRLQLPLNTDDYNGWDYEFDVQIMEKNSSDWEYFQPKYRGSGYLNTDGKDFGISINSHKSPYVYSKIHYIPNGYGRKEDYFARYLSSVSYQQNITNSVPEILNPHEIVKQSIIAMILYSADSEHTIVNQHIKKDIEKFIQLLKIVLPNEICLNNIVINSDSGEVILKTDSGDFVLDSVSGGIGAIIDIVWQMFMTVPENLPYFILIDELENHLHPAMQREILPKLCEAFPNVQFIISTHSPFVVTSVEDASIYILDYDENKKVTAKEISDFKINLSDSTADVLNRVLGVPTTLPEWADKKFSAILKEYKGKILTEEDYVKIVSSMKDENIDTLLPDLIFNISDSEVHEDGENN